MYEYGSISLPYRAAKRNFMHMEFTFKNFEPSEHLKKYARRRLEKAGRFLGKSPALDMVDHSHA